MPPPSKRGQQKPLSPKQQQQLQQLLDQWQPFICAQCHKYLNRNLSFDELYIEVVEAIVFKFHTFDPNKAAFSTWAAIVCKSTAFTLNTKLKKLADRTQQPPDDPLQNDPEAPPQLTHHDPQNEFDPLPLILSLPPHLKPIAQMMLEQKVSRNALARQLKLTPQEIAELEHEVIARAKLFLAQSH